MRSLNTPLTAMPRTKILCSGLALLAYAAAVVLRAPQLLYPGRFWAEEGSMYFAGAFAGSGSASFFTPYAGYYLFPANLAAAIAANAVTLEFAPIVTAAVALLVQLLPAALILFLPIKPLSGALSKAAALALVLFAPPSQEIWLSSTNTQWHLCVCAGLVLVSAPTTGSTWSLCQNGLLLVSGLSGIPANLLSPFFWLSAWREKSRSRAWQAAVLTATSMLQAVIVLISPGFGLAPAGLHGSRSMCFDPKVISHAILSKDILLPATGTEFTSRVMRPLALSLAEGRDALWPTALALAVFALLFFLAAKSGLWEAVFLLASALVLAAIGCAASVEAANTRLHVLSHLSALGAQRYYYAPNVFIALSILMCASRAGGMHWAAKRIFFLAACWLILVGGREYPGSRKDCKWFFSGPEWQSEVAQWRADRSRAIRIWPEGWTLVLKEKRHP